MNDQQNFHLNLNPLLFLGFKLKTPKNTKKTKNPER